MDDGRVAGRVRGERASQASCAPTGTRPFTSSPRYLNVTYPSLSRCFSVALPCTKSPSPSRASSRAPRASTLPGAQGATCRASAGQAAAASSRASAGARSTDAASPARPDPHPHATRHSPLATSCSACPRPKLSAAHARPTRPPRAQCAGCRPGQMQARPDAGPAGCRPGRMQARPDAGPAGCRPSRMQARPGAIPPGMPGALHCMAARSGQPAARLGGRCLPRAAGQRPTAGRLLCPARSAPMSN
jgi:hypothetical protein